MYFLNLYLYYVGFVTMISFCTRSNPNSFKKEIYQITDTIGT